MAEVEVCSFLGARQFVFHLSDGFVSPDNKKRLKEVVLYAADLGVDMFYESNSILVADHAYDILDAFPELGYVLDLGHLNNGFGCGKLGCGIDEFVSQVRSRVAYVHASNNSGQHDDHRGLENGTLDWRHVLDLLDLSQIMKIIIEVRSLDMVEETTAALMHYLEGALLAKKKRAAG
jgi:sugar phosphate isomerase/epimerase